MMKLTKILKNILLEGENYDYGAVILNIDNTPFNHVYSFIEDSELYDGDEMEKGIEDEPHCTLIYGLTEPTDITTIQNIIKNYTFGNLIINNPSLFKKKGYDVLKFDVVEDNVSNINKKLLELPSDNLYGEYQPHITIAYLKKFKGEAIIKRLNKKGYNSFETVPTDVVYSSIDDTVTNIQIRKDIIK